MEKNKHIFGVGDLIVDYRGNTPPLVCYIIKCSHNPFTYHNFYELNTSEGPRIWIENILLDCISEGEVIVQKKKEQTCTL